MKSKSTTNILVTFLFMCGIAELVRMFMNFKIPTTMIITLTTLLIISSLFSFINTKEIKKLSYPLIAIYFLIVVPIMHRLIKNSELFIVLVVLSYILALRFLYSEIKLIKKDKTSKL